MRRSIAIAWAAALLLAALPETHAAPQSRAARDKLLREETARLLEARYQAAFADATTAEARHDLEGARRSLLECLRNKPRDPQALAEMARVDSRIAWVVDWNARVSAIVAALERADWVRAGADIRTLPEAPPAWQSLPHAALVPVLRLGAEGRMKDARQAAAHLAASGPDAAAAGAFARFVNARMRAAALPAGLAAAAGVYLAALFASLYFGLRGALQRTAAP